MPYLYTINPILLYHKSRTFIPFSQLSRSLITVVTKPLHSCEKGIKVELLWYKGIIFIVSKYHLLCVSDKLGYVLTRSLPLIHHLFALLKVCLHGIGGQARGAGHHLHIVDSQSQQVAYYQFVPFQSTRFQTDIHFGILQL